MQSWPNKWCGFSCRSLYLSLSLVQLKQCTCKHILSRANRPPWGLECGVLRCWHCRKMCKWVGTNVGVHEIGPILTVLDYFLIDTWFSSYPLTNSFFLVCWRMCHWLCKNTADVWHLFSNSPSEMCGGAVKIAHKFMQPNRCCLIMKLWSVI